MTLFIQPVAVNDLTSLQSGIQFFTNTAEATAEVASINASPANGPGDSVFIYASKLLNSNLSLSQVAMADSAIMEGGTVAIGNTTTTNTLTYFATQFLPGQVAVAAKFGFNQTVFAAETLGLALAGTAGFQSNFGSLSQAAFITAVSTATGVPTSFLTTFLTNWLNFFNGVGKAAVPAGFTALQAAEGATFGDGIGASLLAPTSANLQTTFSTNASGPNKFSPNTVSGVVANALINIAEDTANGTPGTLYKTGVSLASLPAHTPLFGEFVAAPTTNVFLTTGIDNATNGFSTSPTGSPVLNGFTATASNTTVSGTFGGAGATWTPGDQVTASTGTTGEIFNITGNGTLGAINVTNLPTNKVSGFQTLNVNASTVLGAVASEAVIGDFTAKGPMGDWTGLTTLNVNSGSNLSFVDTLTADPTTAVNVLDTTITGTSLGSPMTVNGGSVDTIIENNLIGPNLGGIVVNGGTGTTKVSITQTETGTSLDGQVTITDAGFATKAAGTITAVVLDGLTSDHFGTAFVNTINDNALANLTVAHSDDEGSTDLTLLPVSADFFPQFIPTNVGAQLVINDNLAPPTATTLNLTLTANGLDPAGFPAAALLITDTNNEISTIHLTLGNQNSFTDFIFNGLTKIDTPNAGTGALISFIEDSVANAVNFDFSGLNGPNAIEVDRDNSGNNADVFTLGNFGTNVAGRLTGTDLTHSQFLDVDQNTSPINTATYNFGSGAYLIVDTFLNNGGHTYNNTAPNGAALGTLTNTDSVGPFAIINMNYGGALPPGGPGEFLTFSAATGISQIDTVGLGPFASVLQGAQAAAAAEPAHTATFFTVANGASPFDGDTFVFAHADTSSAFTANDALVGFVGIHALFSINAQHVITIA